MSTARKVDRARAFAEADFAGISAPADYFDAAVAFSRMIHRITPSLAEELHVPRQKLEDYGNPNRRKRGPHLFLAHAMELALQLKPRDEERHDALAPLHWLARRFRLLVIDAAPARGVKSPAMRAQAIARLLVEFSELVDAVDDPSELDAAGQLRAQQQLQDVITMANELIGTFGAPPAPPSAPEGSNVAPIRGHR